MSPLEVIKYANPYHFLTYFFFLHIFFNFQPALLEACREEIENNSSTKSKVDITINKDHEFIANSP